MITKKQIVTFLLIFILGVSIGFYVVYAQTPPTFWISSGPYPQASYTVYRVDNTYYAKNIYGENVYSGAQAHTVINNAYNDLTSGRTWKEKIVLLGNISVNSELNPQAYTITEIRGSLIQTTPNVSIINILHSHNEVYGGTIIGRADIGDDTIMSGGVRVRGTPNPITDISIHDLNVTNYYMAGIWIRDYVSDIRIYDCVIINATWGIVALGSLGPANSWNIHDLYINNVIGYQNDHWTVSLDREIENFAINNVVSYEGGAVALAGVRHGTVSNCIGNGSDWTHTPSSIPAWNVETTVGWGQCDDITFVNCISLGFNFSAWQVINASNIQWVNCAVYNVSKNGWVVQNSDYLQLTNCVVNDTGNHGFTFWTDGGQDTSYVQMINCRADNIGRLSGTWNGYNFIGTHAGYSSLTSCHAFNVDNDGISFTAAGGTMRVNLCYNDTAWVDSVVY